MIIHFPPCKFIFKIESAISVSCCKYDEVAIFHITERNLDLKDWKRVQSKEKESLDWKRAAERICVRKSLTGAVSVICGKFMHDALLNPSYATTCQKIQTMPIPHNNSESIYVNLILRVFFLKKEHIGNIYLNFKSSPSL